jgi:hypothetical protein
MNTLVDKMKTEAHECRDKTTFRYPVSHKCIFLENRVS